MAVSRWKESVNAWPCLAFWNDSVLANAGPTLRPKNPIFPLDYVVVMKMYSEREYSWKTLARTYKWLKKRLVSPMALCAGDCSHTFYLNSIGPISESLSWLHRIPFWLLTLVLPSPTYHHSHPRVFLSFGPYTSWQLILLGNNRGIVLRHRRDFN